MRIRINESNQKLVNKARGKNLSANAEVNRALSAYYNPPLFNQEAMMNAFVQNAIGGKNARRILAKE